MANYTFSADIIDAALWHAGEKTDGTSDYNAQALIYLNDIYGQVYLGGSGLAPDIQEDWWWLQTTTTLFLETAYDTGTVALTQGSTSATLSTSSADSLANRWLIVDNVTDPYQITAHTAGTTGLTLDENWAPDTNATASYKIVALDYDLPSDLLRLLTPFQVYQGDRGEIYGVSWDQLHVDYPIHDVSSGVPAEFAMIDEDTVRFSHYGNISSSEKIRVDVPYLARPAALTDSGSEEPVIPLEYRPLLAEFVAGRILQDKNDDRADGFLVAAQARLTAMAEENRRRWKNMRKRIGALSFRPGQTERRRLKTVSGIEIYRGF